MSVQGQPGLFEMLSQEKEKNANPTKKTYTHMYLQLALKFLEQSFKNPVYNIYRAI